MRVRLWTVSALVALTVFGAPAAAQALLAISVPTSASLGTGSTGSGTLSAPLGTISVTGVTTGAFVASVTTTVFTTGGGTASETIGKASVSYWSGPATASVNTGSTTPGQLTSANAVDLSVSRTAFSSTGVGLAVTLSWNPTLIVTIPAAAVAGTYTGTITHSVA